MTKATNQKKGIVTRGSGHIAESSGVSLPYFEVLLTGLVMDDNHIETSKCSVAQSAKRTFIEGHNVLHHESKIGMPFGGGPSRYDRPHSFAKNTAPAFKFFAEPTEKSPDTKVEGKWIVRTFDKTVQDGRNGPGQFSPAPNATEIIDEDELLFQQCAVEKIKLECSHGRSTLDGELHVYIGDVVTVTAYRVNASETDPEKRKDIHCHIETFKKKKNPPAEETQHAAFVLTRNGREIAWPGPSWTEIKNKTLVGKNGTEAVEGSDKPVHITTLELARDWLLEAEEEEDEVDAGAEREDLVTEAKHDKLKDQVKTSNQAAAEANKNPKKKRVVKKARKQQGDAQRNLNAFEKEQEARKKNADTADAVFSKAGLALDSFKMVMMVFAFQPLQIQIEAHGCSPGANALVKAYPVDEFEVDLTALKDFPFMNTVAQIKHLVSTVADFFKKIDGFVLMGEPGSTGKKADIGGTIYFFRGRKDLKDCEPVLNLMMGWRELERDTGGDKPRKAWQIHRAWELEVGLERLLGLTITFEVDLNLCAPAAAVFLDILRVLGINAGIFLVVDINLAVGVSGTVGVDEYNEWTFSANGQLSSILKLSLVGKFGEFGRIELSVAGVWQPKFELMKNDKEQTVIHRKESTFNIVVNVMAAVDICGWEVSKEFEIHRWPFEIPEGDMVVFGGGT